jgi:signal transduction histidine kinase
MDPVKIFHAMDSLLASTVKFSRPGSRIEIGVGSRAGKATIWLRTDGSGISAGTLRSLFNPFRKNRTIRSGVESGTALSLAKAKRIVEAHGGATHVHSGEARELTIQLTLPLQKRATAHKKAGEHGT